MPKPDTRESRADTFPEPSLTSSAQAPLVVSAAAQDDPRRLNSGPAIVTISYWWVLRLPQVSELLACACLARLAGRMFDLAIILYTLRRFGSPALTGWVAFAAFGPGLIASPFAGALLDRLRAPLAIIVDMLITAGLVLALIFLDQAEKLGSASLIVLVTMCSLTSPLSASGIRVLIPRLVPDDALERSNALDTGSYALIEVVGPALAGGLFGFAGPAATMIVIVIFMRWRPPASFQF